MGSGSNCSSDDTDTEDQRSLLTSVQKLQNENQEFQQNFEQLKRQYLELKHDKQVSDRRIEKEKTLRKETQLKLEQNLIELKTLQKQFQLHNKAVCHEENKEVVYSNVLVEVQHKYDARIQELQEQLGQCQEKLLKLKSGQDQTNSEHTIREKELMEQLESLECGKNSMIAGLKNQLGLLGDKLRNYDELESKSQSLVLRCESQEKQICYLTQQLQKSEQVQQSANQILQQNESRSEKEVGCYKERILEQNGEILSLKQRISHLERELNDACQGCDRLHQKILNQDYQIQQHLNDLQEQKLQNKLQQTQFQEIQKQNNFDWENRLQKSNEEMKNAFDQLEQEKIQKEIQFQQQNQQFEEVLEKNRQEFQKQVVDVQSQCFELKVELEDLVQKHQSKIQFQIQKTNLSENQQSELKEEIKLLTQQISNEKKQNSKIIQEFSQLEEQNKNLRGQIEELQLFKNQFELEKQTDDHIYFELKEKYEKQVEQLNQLEIEKQNCQNQLESDKNVLASKLEKQKNFNQVQKAILQKQFKQCMHQVKIRNNQKLEKLRNRIQKFQKSCRQIRNNNSNNSKSHQHSKLDDNEFLNYKKNNLGGSDIEFINNIQLQLNYLKQRQEVYI